jgi:AcrR family transcriptional regulator
MAYRRTERVLRRLAARHEAIVTAAAALAAEGGMEAVQIVPVARRAGIAAGTVYRYFPSKTDLVAALVKEQTVREREAMRRAADAAPGPLSALAATITTFAARARRQRKLAWALLGEPVEAGIDPLRSEFRAMLAATLKEQLGAAIAEGHLPEQDTAAATALIVGALGEGLIGPLSPQADGEAGLRQVVQTATLLILRALGVVDARARGLVVQTALPPVA